MRPFSTRSSRVPPSSRSSRALAVPSMSIVVPRSARTSRRPGGPRGGSPKAAISASLVSRGTAWRLPQISVKNSAMPARRARASRSSESLEPSSGIAAQHQAGPAGQPSFGDDRRGVAALGEQAALRLGEIEQRPVGEIGDEAQRAAAEAPGKIEPAMVEHMRLRVAPARGEQRYDLAGANGEQILGLGEPLGVPGLAALVPIETRAPERLLGQGI